MIYCTVCIKTWQHNTHTFGNVACIVTMATIIIPFCSITPSAPFAPFPPCNNWNFLSLRFFPRYFPFLFLDAYKNCYTLLYLTILASPPIATHPLLPSTSFAVFVLVSFRPLAFIPHCSRYECKCRLPPFMTTKLCVILLSV